MVDFFVIGAARSGTSSFFQTFREHPDVFVPDQETYGGLIKEPRFFSENWDKGPDWYDAIFDAPEGMIVGDYSPQYSNGGAKNAVASRIAQYNPDARIVYMVRNPIDCALSNWRMRAEACGRQPPFLEAFHGEWVMTLKHRCQFFHQIAQYRRHFPDEQILVVPLEAIRSDTESWLGKIEDHLGISHQLTNFRRSNVSDKKPNRPGIPVTSVHEREEFLKVIRPDARKLLRHIGQPSNFWKLTVGYKGWEPRAA